MRNPLGRIERSKASKIKACKSDFNCDHISIGFFTFYIYFDHYLSKNVSLDIFRTLRKVKEGGEI